MQKITTAILNARIVMTHSVHRQPRSLTMNPPASGPIANPDACMAVMNAMHFARSFRKNTSAATWGPRVSGEANAIDASVLPLSSMFTFLHP